MQHQIPIAYSMSVKKKLFAGIMKIKSGLQYSIKNFPPRFYQWYDNMSFDYMVTTFGMLDISSPIPEYWHGYDDVS